MVSKVEDPGATPLCQPEEVKQVSLGNGERLLSQQVPWGRGTALSVLLEARGRAALSSGLAVL